jgi:hypothetical protein
MSSRTLSNYRLGRTGWSEMEKPPGLDVISLAGSYWSGSRLPGLEFCMLADQIEIAV